MSSLEILSTAPARRGAGNAILIAVSAIGAVACVVWACIEYAGAARTAPLGAAAGGAFAALAVLTMAAARSACAFRTAVEPRPATPSPPEPATEQTISDRRIARRALGALAAGASALLALVWLPIRSLVVGPVRMRATRWRPGVRLVDPFGRPFGPADTLATATTVFPEGAVGDPRSIAILVSTGGRLRAFSLVCTHAGCAVRLSDDAQHLVCPCHASRFSIAEEGRPIAGPAGKPLPMLPMDRDGEGYLVAAGDFGAPPGPTEG